MKRPQNAVPCTSPSCGVDWHYPGTQCGGSGSTSDTDLSELNEVDADDFAETPLPIQGYVKPTDDLVDYVTDDIDQTITANLQHDLPYLNESDPNLIGQASGKVRVDSDQVRSILRDLGGELAQKNDITSLNYDSDYPSEYRPSDVVEMVILDVYSKGTNYDEVLQQYQKLDKESFIAGSKYPDHAKALAAVFDDFDPSGSFMKSRDLAQVVKQWQESPDQRARYDNDSVKHLHQILWNHISGGSTTEALSRRVHEKLTAIQLDELAGK